MPNMMAESDVEARRFDALVVGAGPAGLAAAEQLTGRGAKVLITEAKPSVGRKFLMAGKSGLNLTFDASSDDLLQAYGDAAPALAPMIRGFDASAISSWAESLGQETFVGSSGRVFPVAMKASPLLRAWLTRLAERGANIETNWRWTGFADRYALFDTPSGEIRIEPDVVVLALGGASWSRLGSDGAWAPILSDAGVPIATFRPSNAGLSVDWSSHMAPFFGSPVKGTALCVRDRCIRSEYVVSSRGLEGGGIYTVFADVRDGADLTVDLLPDMSIEQISRRLGKVPKKDSRSNRLRKALKLDKVRIALFNEFAKHAPNGSDLPKVIKSLPVLHKGPRPLDEAISTAGGVMWHGIDDGLMLRAMPGVFVAGEMLDWEAPTGGYLLTACLATGRWAGAAAADRLGL